ncbi:MAG TPA: 2-hydroxyacid dehydrogenase [Stellaceae bacterium]|nr:2-hydroxyacid dehydrogenase [Stellaceae bacterium]
MKSELLLVCPLYDGTEQRLDELYTVHRLWTAKDQAGLLKDVRDRVRAISTMGAVGCKAELMDALPRTEIIACFGVGVDAIDLKAAKERKIAVTNTPDVLTECVADLGMTLLLAAARQIPQADRYVRDGKWLKANHHLCQHVGGKTLGIVGLGRIGQAVAKRAEAFGIKVVYHSRHKNAAVSYRYYDDIKKMAADVDYLMLTLPGGAETKHLVNTDVLRALGPDGTLINIARGSIVDEKALVQALTSGALGAAALDVFEAEPKVPEELLAMDNVVLQPHQGSATHDTRAAMGQLVIDNLVAHFAGKPLLTRVV